MNYYYSHEKHLCFPPPVIVSHKAQHVWTNREDSSCIIAAVWKAHKGVYVQYIMSNAWKYLAVLTLRNNLTYQRLKDVKKFSLGSIRIAR